MRDQSSGLSYPAGLQRAQLLSAKQSMKVHGFLFPRVPSPPGTSPLFALMFLSRVTASEGFNAFIACSTACPNAALTSAAAPAAPALIDSGEADLIVLPAFPTLADTLSAAPWNFAWMCSVNGVFLLIRSFAPSSVPRSFKSSSLSRIWPDSTRESANAVADIHLPVPED